MSLHYVICIVIICWFFFTILCLLLTRWSIISEGTNKFVKYYEILVVFWVHVCILSCNASLSKWDGGLIIMHAICFVVVITLSSVPFLYYLCRLCAWIFNLCLFAFCVPQRLTGAYISLHWRHWITGKCAYQLIWHKSITTQGAFPKPFHAFMYCMCFTFKYFSF